MLRDENGYWEFNLSPLETVSMTSTALNTTFNLTPASTITLGKVLNQETGVYEYQPYANLYGNVEMNITREDFLPSPESPLAEVISVVQAGLGLGDGSDAFDFVAPNLSFYGLKINHPALGADKKFGLDAVDLTASLTIAGFELSLEGLDLLNEAVTISEAGADVIYENAIGMQFHLEFAGTLNFDLEIWAVKDDPESDYRFGAYFIIINLPELDCQPKEGQSPNFSLAPGVNEVEITFLGDTPYTITQVPGTENWTTETLNFSLRDKLAELGSGLPFVGDISDEDLGLAGLGDTDFTITGITFIPEIDEDGNATGAYTATMNALLTLDIGENEEVSFTGSIPIHPNGIYFNKIKVGPANNIDIGF